MSETLGILEVLRRTEQYLEKAGLEGARLDAEVLLSHILDVARIDLYASYDRVLAPEELDRYRELVRRRADRQPVAYLTGTKEFHSLAFKVTDAVLIPRPDTEHLVDRAVELSRDAKAPRLLDIGTGSGCIAVSWAAEVPAGRFVATDLSADALAVAKENAERHGVADRGTFLAGDLFAPARDHGPFDLVVSNPPYVEPGEEVDPECLIEPAVALFEAGKPLEIYRRLLDGAHEVLEPGGRLLLELPGAKEEEIRALVPPALKVEEVVRDYAGLPRVLYCRYGT